MPVIKINVSSPYYIGVFTAQTTVDMTTITADLTAYTADAT